MFIALSANFGLCQQHFGASAAKRRRRHPLIHRSDLASASAKRRWPRNGCIRLTLLVCLSCSRNMSERICPRSPRETMCGWMHLPRFIDKVRLHLAGKLHSDYQPNFCKGYDGLWLEMAGVQAEQFIDVVRASTTDGQVCDWV